MGSWIDNLKKLQKPEHITVEPISNPRDGYHPLLRVTLQYWSKEKGFKNRVFIIDENVSINLKTPNVNVEVFTGERWGDWGGPIKCGNVIYIQGKENERPKNSKD